MTYTFDKIAHHFAKFLCKDYIISRRLPESICDGFSKLYGIDLYNAECYQFNLSDECITHRVISGDPNVFIVKYNINLKDYNINSNSNMEIIDFAMAPGFVIFVDENIHEEGYPWEKITKTINDAIDEIVSTLTPSGYSSLRSKYYSLIPCYSTIVAIGSRYTITGKDLCEKLNRIHYFGGGIVRYTSEEIDTILNNIRYSHEDIDNRDSFFNVLASHDFNYANPTFHKEDFDINKA